MSAGVNMTWPDVMKQVKTFCETFLCLEFKQTCAICVQMACLCFKSNVSCLSIVYHRLFMQGRDTRWTGCQLIAGWLNVSRDKIKPVHEICSLKGPFSIRILQNGEMTFWCDGMWIIFNQNHTSFFFIFLVFL